MHAVSLALRVNHIMKVDSPALSPMACTGLIPFGPAMISCLTKITIKKNLRPPPLFVFLQHPGSSLLSFSSARSMLHADSIANDCLVHPLGLQHFAGRSMLNADSVANNLFGTPVVAAVFLQHSRLDANSAVNDPLRLLC